MPRLNRSGSATIKFRYWSYTWETFSAVPLDAIWDAKSSRSGLGTADRKLTYAGE